jgi:hypothetical protein
MIRGHGVSRSTSDNSSEIFDKKLGIDQTSEQTTPGGKLIEPHFWSKYNLYSLNELPDKFPW